MCEAENLIIAIEKYPCLWDIKNTDYHNRDVKDLAWEEVCKEIINDWDKCTDKTNKCADLKKKWTNIRDYYRKGLQRMKNAPTGSAAKKVKKYVYSDLLYFLAPIFHQRNSEENYHSDVSDKAQTLIESKTQEDVSIIQGDIKIMQPSGSDPTPVHKKKQKKKDDPTQILSMLQQRERTTIKPNDEEDDDTKFLLSFRSYMKQMNTNQKINFQMGMLQLVKNIIGDYSSSSRSKIHNN